MLLLNERPKMTRSVTLEIYACFQINYILCPLVDYMYTKRTQNILKSFVCGFLRLFLQKMFHLMSVMILGQATGLNLDVPFTNFEGGNVYSQADTIK